MLSVLKKRERKNTKWNTETNLRKINKIRLDVLNEIRPYLNCSSCKQTKFCLIVICTMLSSAIAIYTVLELISLHAVYSNISSNNIPKIVHQIWIGSPVSDMPTYKKLFMNSFKTKLGKDWQYVLWTDDNLTQQNFNLTWEYQQMARKAAKEQGVNKFAQIADLMKYEIVYKHGGFYADTNMELFQSLDPLINNTFVIAHEDGLPKSDYCSVGFFGGIKGHPALEALLQKDVLDKRNHSRWDVNWITGPGFFGSFVYNRSDITTLDSDLIYPTFQGKGWMAINLTRQDKCMSLNHSDGWTEVIAKDDKKYFWKFPCDQYPNSIMADHFALGASWA